MRSPKIELLTLSVVDDAGQRDGLPTLRATSGVRKRRLHPAIPIETMSGVARGSMSERSGAALLEH